LIFFTFISHGIVAFKSVQEEKWVVAQFKRRPVVVPGGALKDKKLREGDSSKRGLSANGVEEDVVVAARRTSCSRPWRISVDGPRAILDTVIAGLGYLL
jgi:hypothetical protein